MTSFDLNTARQDYFSLFGLPRSQRLDVAHLEALYRDIQAKVHPDKHAHLSDSEKRLAMQWATHVNEAYQTLRDPLRRARYLLELAGHDVALEKNTAMPPQFLIEQMELREAVAEAKEAQDLDRLDELHRRIRKEIAGEYARLEAALDGGRYDEAAGLVRELMFREKLFQEIDDALAALEA
ncbi:MAG: Fe-S protein assembly co-chaperone HscB [Rhodocyclaceae bacterium]|nr:Fe-S protein assembly co-chaperone HscB [Rhodocyclaceae bacterium]